MRVDLQRARPLARKWVWTLAFALVAIGTLASAPATASRRPSAEPPAGPLPFLHDDYATALAQARSANKPLFVEFWAPW